MQSITCGKILVERLTEKLLKKYGMKNYSGFKNNMLTGIKHIETINKKTYWLVKCDCGTEKVMLSNKAFCKTSKTKSCGCLRNTINSINSGLSAKISAYKKGAKERSLSYELSNDLFEKITSSNCHYCGVKPMQISKKGKNIYLYNGIDRVDNLVGYVAGNVVPCCVLCNKAKRDLDVTVFNDWIMRLSRYHYFLIN